MVGLYQTTENVHTNCLERKISSSFSERNFLFKKLCRKRCLCDFSYNDAIKVNIYTNLKSDVDLCDRLLSFLNY